MLKATEESQQTEFHGQRGVGMPLNKFAVFTIIMLLASLYPYGSVEATHATAHITYNLVDVRWGRAGEILEPKPGDQLIPLTIKITPSSFSHENAKATGVNGTLVFNSLIFGGRQGGERDFDAVPGQFAAGDEISFTFMLTIYPNVKLGVYYVDLQIDSFVKGQSSMVEANRNLLKVPIEVSGRPDLEFSLDSNILSPGVVNPVKLTVKNRGQASARFINATISAQDMVILGHGKPLTIDLLEAGSSTSIPLNLYVRPSKSNSVIPASLTISYKTAYGNTLAKTETLSLTVGASPRLFDAKISSTTLTRGNTNLIKVFLTYLGAVTAKDVRIYASTSSQLEVLGSKERVYAQVQPNTTISLDLLLKPNQQAETATVNLRTDLLQLNNVSVSTELAFGFVVTSSEKRAILLNVTPTQIKSGTLNKLTLNVANIGQSVLADIELTLESSGDALLIASDRIWNINQLQVRSSENIPLSLFIPQSTRQGLTLTFNIKSVDLNNKLAEESASLNLLVSQIFSSPLTVSINNQDIIGGIKTDHNLKIENVGDKQIENIQVVLGASDPIKMPSGERRLVLGTLQPRNAGIITLSLLAPENSIGTGGTLNIKFSYTYDSVFQEEERFVDLVVRGKVDLIFSSLTVSPKQTTPGSSVTVSGAIFNSGNIKAQAVNVTITSNSASAMNEPSSETFIGEISDGGEAPFSATVPLPRNIPTGVQALKLTVGYKDDRGIWQATSREIQVGIADKMPLIDTIGNQVSSSPQSPILSMPIETALVVAVVVTAGLLGLKLGARKERRKLNVT